MVGGSTVRKINQEMRVENNERGDCLKAIGGL